MPMDPLFVLGVVKAVGGAGTAYLNYKRAKKESKLKKEAYHDEAVRLQRTSKDIEKFLSDNSYSEDAIQEALKRIGTVIDNSTSQIKNAIQMQTEGAIKQMQDQFKWSNEDLAQQLSDFNDVMNEQSDTFRRTWQEGFNKMKDTLARGRLLRSGVNYSLSNKQSEQLHRGELKLAKERGKTEKEFARQKTRLNEQLQSQVRRANTDASSQIARAMAQGNLTKLQMQQAQENLMRQQNKQISQFGLGQKLNLQNQIAQLDTQRKIAEAQQPTGWEAVLGGMFSPAVLSGATDIVTSLKK